MLDAARILGGLLAQRARQGGVGSNIVTQVLTQVASGAAAQSHGPDPLGGLMRDAYARATYPPGHQPPIPQYHPHQHQSHSHGYNQQQLDARSIVLIRAMVAAAKADGMVDQAEQQRIIQQLWALSPSEVQFLQHEFAMPLDVHGFARSVPQGMEVDVYAISLIAIIVDTNYEAAYLRELAGCLRLPPQIIHQIHTRYGVPCPNW